jgi:hypothetical protein
MKLHYPLIAMVLLFFVFASCGPEEATTETTCQIPCDGLPDLVFGDPDKFDTETANWRKFASEKLPNITENVQGLYLSRAELLKILSEKDGDTYVADGIVIYYGLEAGDMSTVTTDEKREDLVYKKLKPYIASVKPGTAMKVRGSVLRGCPSGDCTTLSPSAE